MKRFAIKIGLFILPIVFIGLAMEIFLREIPNNFKFKTEQLISQADSIETIVIGNSHSLYGIDPDFFEDYTFNLSQVSQSPDLDLKVFGKFAPKLPKLKTLIINLSYDNTFEQLESISESWRLKNYNIYYELNSDRKISHRFEILAVSIKYNMKRIVDYYIRQLSSISINEFGRGTDAHSKFPKDLEIMGKITAEKHTAKSDEFYLKNQLIYRSLIEYCGKKNIKIVAVTIPTYKSYYENLNINQLNKTICLGKSLDKEYINLKYYNFLKDSTFNASDFFDADHLNENGAKKFSLLLNDILNH